MLEATSLPIDQQLARLPDQPGVYKFYDGKGVLLYVGKAKSLRSRVRSYFLKTATLEPHKRQMVTEIADIQYLLAETPTQALHFEADLVRHERPRYNVKLRDDKHYPYIRINVQDPWPKTMVARKMQDRKSTRLNSSHLVISYAVFCLKKKTVVDAARSERRGGDQRPHSDAESEAAPAPDGYYKRYQLPRSTELTYRPHRRDCAMSRL